MSDIADDADNQVAAFAKTAMQRKKPNGPDFTGFCANCGEPVQEPLRWCCVECRDDEQKRAGRSNA
jgi:hypothetical protein